MKKAVFIFIIFLAVFIPPAPVKADDNPRVFLDGQELSFSVPPVIVDGRVMVPLREITQYLSLPLQWDAPTMTAAIYADNCCTVGCSEAWIRSEPVELDVPPMIINGRLLVPLRFMAEVARCSADYNPTEQIVQLRSTGGESGIQLDNSVWIYYSQNFTPRIKYRQKPDGSEKTIVYSGYMADSMKLCDNNIYFAGAYSEDKRQLYKIAESGIPSVLERADVSDSWRYWVDSNNCYILANSGTDKTAIEKQDLATGTTAVVVENPVDYEPFKIYNGWIYYTDNSDHCFSRVKTAGGLRSKILDGTTLGFIVENAKIFFINSSYRLCKCNLDGTEQTVVSSDTIDAFVLDDEWVYYTKFKDGIWKVKTDGTNRTKICDDGCFELTVKNGWVYYSNDKANGMLYAIKTDGTCKTKITTQTVENIIVK